MKRFLSALAVAGVAMWLVAPTSADWNEGDDHKMHFPQLPDSDGWDVHFTTESHTLADDFQCTQSGLITDIHFWYSWSEDTVGDIEKIHASIHADIPDPDENGLLYSMPGATLWQKDFTPGGNDVTLREYGSGDQGFYAPGEGYVEDDHQGIWQANLYIDEVNAFQQQEGTIYWLDLYVELADVPENALAGWKTADVERYPEPYTGQHFNDDAVYWEDLGNDEGEWRELVDPVTGTSLDLAFVITPEPSTWVLLLVGAVAGVLTYFRRRR